MAEDRGKTALVSVVLVTFSVGVATGWLLNSFARKVRRTFLSASAVIVLHRDRALTLTLQRRS